MSVRLVQWLGMLAIAIGIAWLHSLPVGHDTLMPGGEPNTSVIAADAGDPAPDIAHMRATSTDSGGGTHRDCAGCDEPDRHLLECLAAGCLTAIIVFVVAWLRRPRLPARWRPLGVAQPGSAAISMILRTWIRTGPRLVELSISRT